MVWAKKNKRQLFEVIIYVLILILGIYGVHNVDQVFVKNTIDGILLDYLKSMNNILKALLTILFLAISFKTISTWEMTVNQFILKKYKIEVYLFFIGLIIIIIINLLKLNMLLDSLENLGAYASMLIQVTLLYINLLMAEIILETLFFAGEKKRADEDALKIFKRNPNTIIDVIDFDRKIDDNKYFSFLQELNTEILEEIYFEITKKQSRITNFEYLIFIELVFRIDKGEKINDLILDDRMRYIEFIYRNKIESPEILIKCASVELLGSNFEKVFLMFKKLIDEGNSEVSSIYNPELQKVYFYNETLIDELIIYAMEKPNQNKEIFIYNLLEKSIQASGTYVENDLIKIANIKDNFFRIHTNEVVAYFKNETNIKELSYNNYENFLNKINKLESTKLLDYLQNEYNNVKNHGKEGLYTIKYLKIFYEYEVFGKKINLIIKDIPYNNENVHLNNDPFSVSVNFKNVKYCTLAEEYKDKIVAESIKFNENIKKIVEDEVNKNNWIEMKNEAVKNLEKQLKDSNYLSVEVFLKIYKYIIEDKNQLANNLSEDFYASFQGIIEQNNFMIYPELLSYVVNINFILYDKNIRKYGKFNRISFNSDIFKEKIKIINDENFKLTYPEAFQINYAMGIIQYYIDEGKLPEVIEYFTKEDIVREIVVKALELINNRYENINLENFFHKMPVFTDYKYIRRVSKGLNSQKKVNRVLSDSNEIRFEKRIVFASLLKLLVGIESPYEYNNEEHYHDCVENLLKEIGIEYEKPNN